MESYRSKELIEIEEIGSLRTITIEELRVGSIPKISCGINFLDNDDKPIPLANHLTIISFLKTVLDLILDYLDYNATIESIKKSNLFDFPPPPDNNVKIKIMGS